MDDIRTFQRGLERIEIVDLDEQQRSPEREVRELRG
jgi:hypothetical protein